MEHEGEQKLDNQPSTGKEKWSDADSFLTAKVENELNLHDSTSESTTKDVDETTNDEEYSQIKVENEKIIQENIHGDSLSFYNPIDFNGMNIPANIKELFHFTTKYRPSILEMETKLKPFLPDFIPAVGDPDAFLKVERPDREPELLGLSIIDEISLNQSDASVLDLRLRSIYKRSSAKTVTARTVEDGNKSKAIDKWIKDISELHRSKPLPNVSYNKAFPDIDTLLQEWSPEVDEEIFGEVSLLPSDLACDLVDYVNVSCGLLDIPVYSGERIHSLHLLLTLYSEMGRLQK